MKIQQVLEMSTETSSFRSSAIGWDAHDPTLFAAGKKIGMTPPAKFYFTYDSPFAALADGWHLLAPATKEKDNSWSWIFVRDTSF